MAVQKDFFKYNPETDGNLTFNIDKALNENWDKVNEGFRQLAEKPAVVKAKLAAPSWDSNIYSFEATYPASSYNIALSYDGDSFSADSKEAFDGAGLVGSATENKFIATGDVPTIDIPVILEVIPR